MPHNLYLHSSIVQTREYERTPPARREAVRFAFDRLDDRAAVCALHQRRDPDRGRGGFLRSGNADVAEIQDAYKLLTPLLGAGASTAVRPRAAGLGPELDAHRHAGRPDRHGRLPQHPHAALAAPADHARHRDHAGGDRGCAVRRVRHGKLLVLSQVILSLQLSFAVFPLVMFTSDKLKMGEFVNPLWT